MNSPAVRARLAATKRTKQFIREFPAVVRAVVEKELPNLETSLAAMCGNPSVACFVILKTAVGMNRIV